MPVIICLECGRKVVTRAGPGRPKKFCCEACKKRFRRRKEKDVVGKIKPKERPRLRLTEDLETVRVKDSEGKESRVSWQEFRAQLREMMKDRPSQAEMKAARILAAKREADRKGRKDG